MCRWIAGVALWFLVSAAAVAQTPLAHPGQPGWTRSDGGCFVWNAMPQVNETVSWSGGCAGGRANGTGTEIWRWSGKEAGRYIGTMRDGKANGHGVYTWATGVRFEGEFRDDKFNGHGVKTWATGDRFEGEFRDDKFNGHGVKTWADGNRYEGEWRDGKANGVGRLVAADGTTFNGVWTNGCFKDGNRRAWVGVDQSSCP